MSPYRLPALLWLASWLGLALCLFGDGGLDLVGAIVLSVPLLAVLARLRRRAPGDE
ncbi:MAG TPA: hypothetical protein RMH99_04745 [Sandaracinaceae bacterium LLY-WYZ-13_1]|nr:hypothetical protein [Sandaracinaceae bacterium LLY-WYZ-13_1]